MDIKAKGLTLKIGFDYEPLNPREEWDNLGTFFSWHRRYRLGEQNPYPTSQDFHSDKDLQDSIFVKLPVYMYDHSGITISTSPFSCKWDSGQVGLIFVTKDNVLKEYGDLSEETKGKVTKRLNDEIEIYDHYLTSNFYCYSILDQEGGLLDCVGNFCGKSFKEVLESMREAAPAEYDFLFDKMIESQCGSTEM